MKRIILFIVVLVMQVVSVRSGDHAVGVSASYMKELYPDRYYYRVTNIQADYRYVFGNTGWCDFHALGSLHYAITQYSAVAFPTGDYRNGYGFGFTAGMLWNVFIYKDYVSVYGGGFIGPMYTPTMPARQGGKLNFSDNLCVGFNVKLYQGLFVDLRLGFRHMSNAGLARPNYGINDHFCGIGFFYKFSYLCQNQKTN